jgi:hypothetical protein
MSAIFICEDNMEERVMTDEERAGVLKQLSAPFDLREIKWRVTNTGDQGRRGAVNPYADPRAYKDRLNSLFSPNGWSESYEVTVVEHSIRRKGGQAEMITGKILVTCKVSIPGVGEHSGTGEEWSDAECAMTSADAQAFKRACSSFGLGRYLYSIPEQWVKLDQKKRPLEIPKLPDWAKPNGGNRQATGQQSTGPQQKGEVLPPTEDGRRPTREKLDSIHSYREHFGNALFFSQLTGIARVRNLSDIRDEATADRVLAVMNRTFGGIQKARDLAEGMSVGQFDYIMQKLQIRSLDSIPTVQALIDLVRALEEPTKRAA